MTSFNVDMSTPKLSKNYFFHSALLKADEKMLQMLCGL